MYLGIKTLILLCLLVGVSACDSEQQPLPEEEIEETTPAVVETNSGTSSTSTTIAASNAVGSGSEDVAESVESETGGSETEETTPAESPASEDSSVLSTNEGSNGDSSDNEAENSSSYTVSLNTPLVTTASTPLKTKGSITCALSQDLSAYPDATLKLIIYNGTEIRKTENVSVSAMTIDYTLIAMDTAGSLGEADVRGNSLKCSAQLFNDTTAISDVSESETLTVANTIPTLALASGDITNQDVAAGASIANATFEATDLDGDTVTYSRSNSGVCPGLSIDSSSGVLSGTMPNSTDPATNMTCSFSVVATDSVAGESIAISATFASTNSAPTISCDSTGMYGVIGSSATLNCIGADNDAGSTLSYSVDNTCSGTSINSSGQLSITAVPSSDCTATVTVSDGLDSANTSIIIGSDLQVSWDGSPSLSNACILDIPGTTTLRGSASYSASTGSTFPQGSVFSSTMTGLSGFLDSLTETAFDNTWSVVTDSGSFLSLTRSVDLVKSSNLTTSSTDLDFMGGGLNKLYTTMEGMQIPLAGGCQTCTTSASDRATVAAGGGNNSGSYGGHACSVYHGNGTAGCWGYGALGQLGDGNTGNHDWPTGTGQGVIALSAGRFHTCGIDSSANVHCWGSDSDGQLGNGAAGSSSSPAQISGLSDIVTLASGVLHSCALDADGKVYCWGRNTEGQLGNGTTTEATTPVEITSLGTNVRSIHAGGNQTCAILADGDVQCWGANDSDTILGSENSQENAPVSIKNELGSTSRVVQIEPGEGFVCALFGNHEVKCWGDGALGQLGNGSFSSSDTPVSVDFSGFSSDPVALTAGGLHSCVVFADKTAACWGQGNSGELGNAATSNSNTPVKVVKEDSGTAALGDIIAINAGRFLTCTMQYDQNGTPTIGRSTVRCWGKSSYGEAGGFSNASRPTQIAGVSYSLSRDTCSTYTIE